jgi:hypothetical protein
MAKGNGTPRSENEMNAPRNEAIDQKEKFLPQRNAAPLPDRPSPHSCFWHKLMQAYTQGCEGLSKEVRSFSFQQILTQIHIKGQLKGCAK